MNEKLRILIFVHNASHEHVAAEGQLAGDCKVVTVFDDPDNLISCVQTVGDEYDSALLILAESDFARRGDVLVITGKPALMLRALEDARIPTLPLSLNILLREPVRFFSMYYRETHEPRPATPISPDELVGCSEGTFGRLYLSRNWREILRILRTATRV